MAKAGMSRLPSSCPAAPELTLAPYSCRFDVFAGRLLASASHVLLTWAPWKRCVYPPRVKSLFPRRSVSGTAGRPERSLSSRIGVTCSCYGQPSHSRQHGSRTVWAAPATGDLQSPRTRWMQLSTTPCRESGPREAPDYRGGHECPGPLPDQRRCGTGPKGLGFARQRRHYPADPEPSAQARPRPARADGSEHLRHAATVQAEAPTPKLGTFASAGAAGDQSPAATWPSDPPGRVGLAELGKLSPKHR